MYSLLSKAQTCPRFIFTSDILLNTGLENPQIWSEFHPELKSCAPLVGAMETVTQLPLPFLNAKIYKRVSAKYLSTSTGAERVAAKKPLPPSSPTFQSLEIPQRMKK